MFQYIYFRFLIFNMHVIKFFIRQLREKIGSRNLPSNGLLSSRLFDVGSDVFLVKLQINEKTIFFDVISRSSKPFSQKYLTLTVWAMYLVIGKCTHNMNQYGTKIEIKKEREKETNFSFVLERKTIFQSCNPLQNSVISMKN